MSSQIDYRAGLSIAKSAYMFSLQTGKTNMPRITANCAAEIIYNDNAFDVITDSGKYGIVRLTRADGATRDYDIKKSWI